MITNGYATLIEMRAELNITGATDTGDDAKIELAVEAASRWIDDHCGRRFYTTAADETRYYTAEFSDLLFAPDDIVSVTTLATDSDGDRTYETTWAATDYDLEPLNATLDGKPYTRIATTPNGSHAFPTTRRGVKVVGKFGYSTAAPAPIKRACILLASRLFKRKDAVFGVMGISNFGQVMLRIQADPDVLLLLRSFERVEVIGV